MMSSPSRLILASNSPRRKSLLAEAGFSFDVISLKVDETYPEDIEPRAVAKYLAEKKNRAYRNEITDGIIITADTTVVFKNKLLEKPQNAVAAKEMITALSGQAHSVVTGVCISSITKVVSFSSETKVVFRKLDPEEIDHYIEKFKPYDKAGAYGIQEWIGLTGIEKIEGSYFNVMGLPTDRVYNVLVDQFDLRVTDR